MWRPKQLDISWSLQSSLPPAFTSPISPLFLVQGPAAHLSSLSPSPSVPKCYHQCSAGTSWTVNASLCHLGVEWLNSLTITRAADCEAVSSYLYKASSTSSSWSDGLYQTQKCLMLACPLILTCELLTHSSSSPWQRWIILVAFSHKEQIHQPALLAYLS